MKKRNYFIKSLISLGWAFCLIFPFAINQTSTKQNYNQTNNYQAQNLTKHERLVNFRHVNLNDQEDFANFSWYYLPIYEKKAVADFGYNAKATNLNDYFPQLIRKDDNGKYISATFKQMFISEKLAQNVVDACRCGLKISSEIIEITNDHGITKFRNHLGDIKDLTMNGKINDASIDPKSKNNVMQYLSALFVNPHLYAESFDGITIENKAFQKMHRLDLRNNKITNLLAGTFNKIRYEKSDDSDLIFDLSDNYMSAFDYKDLEDPRNYLIDYENIFKQALVPGWEKKIHFSLNKNRFVDSIDSHDKLEKTIDDFLLIKFNDARFVTKTTGEQQNSYGLWIEPKYEKKIVSMFLDHECNKNIWPSYVNKEKTRNKIFHFLTYTGISSHYIDQIDLESSINNPYLPDAKWKDVIKIDFNDFTGLLNVNFYNCFESRSLEEIKNIYSETLYLNNQFIPLIIILILILASSTLIGLKIRNIVKWGWRNHIVPLDYVKPTKK